MRSLLSAHGVKRSDFCLILLHKTLMSDFNYIFIPFVVAMLMFYAHVAVSRRTPFLIDRTLTHPRLRICQREANILIVGHSNGMLTRPGLPSSAGLQAGFDVVFFVFVSHSVLAPCCAPTFSTAAHALTNHSALINTLIFFVIPAASPSTRRLSTAPISRPGDTKKPQRQSLEHCQQHHAYARCAE
jgi:hypothetical protein